MIAGVLCFAHSREGGNSTHGDRDPQHFYDHFCSGHGTKLYGSAGYGHHAVFHVGIPYLPQRHSGAPPEVDFRFELRAGNVDSVCVFWRLFRFLDSVGKNNRLDGISAVNGGWSTYDGIGSFPLCPGGERSIVSIVPVRPHRSGRRNHLLTGCGKSLCHSVGEAGGSFEPTKLDTGIQLSGHFPGAVLWWAADSKRDDEVHRRYQGARSGRTTALPTAGSCHGKDAVCRFGNCARTSGNRHRSL